MPKPAQEEKTVTIGQRILTFLKSIKAWMALPAEPDWMEQVILDSLSEKRKRPESDRAKYIKALEDLVADQKKTIKMADAVVEQAQLSAKNQADITPALINEVNRLRAENAMLSGAYLVAVVEMSGKRKLVRFSLN
jgi:uncharacterized coiled-coil protein SlyX